MLFSPIYNYYLMFLSLLNIMAAMIGAVNYCDKSLCKNGFKHVACGHNGRFSAACPADAKVIDLTPYKDLLLKEVNRKRNNLAGGKLPGYEPSKRMATMIWDNELAALATLNVKQCKMLHDKCYATTSYSTPGQNIFQSIGSSLSTEKNFNNSLSKAINIWWAEYNQGSMKLIEAINYNTLNFKKIGHFAALAKDDSNALGCAAASYTINNRIYTLITCNFARMHYPGKAVYEVGLPTSGCTKGGNPHYEHLCSIKEVYN